LGNQPGWDGEPRNYEQCQKSLKIIRWGFKTAREDFEAGRQEWAEGRRRRTMVLARGLLADAEQRWFDDIVAEADSIIKENLGIYSGV
jgi:hypothetical protein